MPWRPHQFVDTGPSVAVTLTKRVGSVDPATGPAAGLAAAVVLGPAMGNAAGLVAHGGSCALSNLVSTRRVCHSLYCLCRAVSRASPL